MSHAVTWFDIPARDIDRAIAFYSAVLGADISKQGHSDTFVGVLPHGNDDVSGCIYQREGDEPSASGPLLYFNAEGRLDEAIAAVEVHGGTVVRPKHSIEPYGFRAIVLDSEGNRIALHSMV